MSYRVLILSDSHLFGSRSQQLFGVNTFKSLEQLSQHIRSNEQVFDLLVASGDLSEDGHTKAYKDFHRLTRGLARETLWMKGNHDRFENVPGELAASAITTEKHMQSWSIIFLDTTIIEKDEGMLDVSELYRLKLFLETYKEKHVMIFMHHHPVEVGSDFIDVLGLQNKQEFHELISQYQNVGTVVFGHVHQIHDSYFQGIRMLSSPSTSMQFKPGSKDLAFDEPTHGYRTISLNRDGSIHTEVQRIRART